LQLDSRLPKTKFDPEFKIKNIFTSTKYHSWPYDNAANITRASFSLFLTSHFYNMKT
jgi:hypothetical protein